MHAREAREGCRATADIEELSQRMSHTTQRQPHHRAESGVLCADNLTPFFLPLRSVCEPPLLPLLTVTAAEAGSTEVEMARLLE